MPRPRERALPALLLLLSGLVGPALAADTDDLERLRTNGRCPGCDLRGADLVGADLAGADLRDARLEGADLRGAVLRGADLRGVRLEGARFAHGVVCGPPPAKGGFGCTASLPD